MTTLDEIAAMRQRVVKLHSEAWRRGDDGLDLTLEAMRIEAEADALEEAILDRAAQEPDPDILREDRDERKRAATFFVETPDAG